MTLLCKQLDYYKRRITFCSTDDIMTHRNTKGAYRPEAREFEWFLSSLQNFTSLASKLLPHKMSASTISVLHYWNPSLFML